MDKKKLDQFKKRLEERQQEMRKAVSRTEQDGRAADSETAQDIADKAANSYNKEFLFHQSNNERQLLAMVEGALDRIRTGTFGQCISCAEEINSKRLEAVPWTRFCINSQEKMERGQLENAGSADSNHRSKNAAARAAFSFLRRRLLRLFRRLFGVVLGLLRLRGLLLLLLWRLRRLGGSRLLLLPA